MITQKLYKIIQTQQKKIKKLQKNEWSNLNGYQLYEMINILTETVDKINSKEGV